MRDRHPHRLPGDPAELATLRDLVTRPPTTPEPAPITKPICAATMRCMPISHYMVRQRLLQDAADRLLLLFYSSGIFTG
jgi:hypothetical protein